MEPLLLRQTVETAIGFEEKTRRDIPKELADAIALVLILDNRPKELSLDFLHGAFSGIAFALRVTRNCSPQGRLAMITQIGALLGGQWIEAMDRVVAEKPFVF